MGLNNERIRRHEKELRLIRVFIYNENGFIEVTSNDDNAYIKWMFVKSWINYAVLRQDQTRPI